MKAINGGMNLEGRRRSTNVIDIRNPMAAAIWAAIRVAADII
ncbi:MAG: hypothetical protein ACK5KN_04115 [Dysgonomonas sp.]